MNDEMVEDVIIEARHVTKKFPGVVALDDINLKIFRGEVHVLLGENGAGKSTFIKLLTGANDCTNGELFLENKPLIISHPTEAYRFGIGVVYQELNLIPDLSVEENLFLTNEPLKNKFFGVINWRETNSNAKKVLKQFHLDVDPHEKVGTLGVGKQQMVEIAKCLVKETKIIILDEPTASLSGSEIDQLVKLIKTLKNEGVTIIFISHKLDEVMAVGDRVTVLRDGKKIDTLAVKDTNKENLVKLMVGRSLSNMYPKIEVEKGQVALEVKNLSRKKKFSGISFSVHEGEILGIYGVVGAGRSEVARCIFGLDRKDCGDVVVGGRKVDIGSPCDAIKNGIGFLTEDRKNQGLILKNTVEFNTNLVSLPCFAKRGVIKKKQLNIAADKVSDQLRIKVPNRETLCLSLSGGNQQKVVIAKWISAGLNVFIIDEPTRGIDVGAKAEVYNIICDLVSKGIAVVLISSELEEIISISDRVIVMREGQIVNAFEDSEISEENIVRAAIGG